MRERNVVTCILLTIITCGIYGIVWFINLTDDAARANNNPNFSGGTAFLLTLVTCGIYGYYWAYKMAKANVMAKSRRGMPADDNTVLYIILQVFGLGVINYCLMQNDLNDMARIGQGPNQQNNFPYQNMGV